MLNNIALKARQAAPRVGRLALSSAPIFLMLAPHAFAQAVAGEIDPESGLNTLFTVVLVLVNVGFVGTAMYKGLHAFMDGRSFGGIVAALVVGLALADGGYYLLKDYGVTSTSA